MAFPSRGMAAGKLSTNEIALVYVSVYERLRQVYPPISGIISSSQRSSHSSHPVANSIDIHPRPNRSKEDDISRVNGMLRHPPLPHHIE